MEVISMSVNKVIVVGNLGADPVVRALPNAGQKVANFSVASTERFTDRSGARQERTEWFRVVAFGKLADTCGQFLSRGRQVYVEGRLSTREYQARDGSGKRYVTEIVARQIRFLGGHSDTKSESTDVEIPF
jgi:single-strand DNA-binding protein